MSNRTRIASLLLLALLAGTSLLSWDARAQQDTSIQWIWFNEGEPAKDAPAGTRFFRKTFELKGLVDEAVLDITADNGYKVWVNGKEIGKGDDWKQVDHFDVKKHMASGQNVLAVEAMNDGGPAGLMARLNYVPTGRTKTALVSDGSWKAAKTAAEGWTKTDFDDAKWEAAKVLGPVGKAGPWQGQSWAKGDKPVKGAEPRFTVPTGFSVELAVQKPADRGPFSLVNMCFDNKGRLLVSQEGGPILLCTKLDKNGVLEDVKPYCEQVKNCQGMCWVDDALLLVGNGPKGTGLYRVRDTKGEDKTDEVTLLFSYQGGMGEHGPHAVIHGPDDQLYLVIGNHAWAKVDQLAPNSPLRRWPKGGPGPDQGKPGVTEDVLLPRLNDANGHAANILAPGGTIWRLDKDGKNISHFSAGYRNHFDAAFNPLGELFTFDSDMEWDIGLPWYRDVRICHATPGSDFVWRTGAANTPNYYLDSLPPLAETGRGSPVGVEFYDHTAYPAKYRGDFFMADWSIGTIYAVHLDRDGAGYKAKYERFCSGNPMNVTDCAVGPDGFLYFTMGGRGTQGGVYRISYTPDKPATPSGTDTTPIAKLLQEPQPLAAWSRARVAEQIKKFPGGKEALVAALEKAAESELPAGQRLRAMTLLREQQPAGNTKLFAKLATDANPEIRGHAIYMLGVSGAKESQEALLKALGDDDKLVQRRACDALIRAGIEPPVDKIWPLLGDKDVFLRTAARLVLERIDPKQWAERIAKEENDAIAWQAIVALCKTDQAAPYAEAIYARLNRPVTGEAALLDQVRTTQLALIHAPAKGTAAEAVKAIAARDVGLFPAKDPRLNRELAILLAHLRKTGATDKPVHAALLKAMQDTKDDRLQQIHYFYCLRPLQEGWTADQKEQLLTWFNETGPWSGGNSFKGFLENTFRELNPIFTAEDRARVLAKVDQLPRAAAVLLKMAPANQLPSPAELVLLYERLGGSKASPQLAEVKAFVINGLSTSTAPEAQAALRKIADAEPAQRDLVAKALSKNPSAENWPYIVRGLQAGDKILLVDVVEALKKSPTKPKLDEPIPFRSALLASSKFDEKDVKNRWKFVELLRHWGAKSFGSEKPDESKEELLALARWFSQSFPKEGPLPGSLLGKPPESKYKYDELLVFLDKEPEGKKGDPARGRVVFEKASCLKCHKYGKEGEGIGPDLTALSKRFKRADMLESILDPSKIISDQYRSTVIETKKGVQLMGLASTQGDVVTVLQSDGTKVTLKKEDIASQVASLISVMPEKLLDTLSKQEIADLFAFMESEPVK